jgi:hypothetical protein
VIRAAERLAGARGKFFLRGPYLKEIFFPVNNPPVAKKISVRGKKIFRTSTLQLLSRDFISFFYAQFRYLSQKTDSLSFARKYLTHKKDWGPTKKFRGPPAPRGPGQFPPPANPLCGPDCDYRKFHCDYEKLHCDYRKLHCDYRKLHCDYRKLHCGDYRKLHKIVWD